MMLFFDFALISSGVGAILGLAFFFVFAAIAFVTYKMLRKTVKMAMRMAIVAAILLIALIGSVSFLIFSSSSRNSKDAPTVTPTTKKPR